MLSLTLLALSSATLLISSMWSFGRLDQEDKVLFIELFDDNKI